jgi:hypothetical protein
VVKRGSVLEAALLVHEQVEQQKSYLSMMLLATSANLKKDQEVKSQIQELYFPGSSKKEEETMQGQLAYLRSLQDVNWGSLFKVDSKYISEDPATNLEEMFAKRKSL